mgnify:FL=1
MPFAEAVLPPHTDASSIGWLLLGLAGLGAAFLGLERWIRRMAGQPDNERTIGGQPIEIRQSREFVTREELERDRRALIDRVSRIESDVTSLTAELARWRQELHQTELRINAAGEDRASKIHDRINVVLEAVAELRGKTQ